VTALFIFNESFADILTPNFKTVVAQLMVKLINTLKLLSSIFYCNSFKNKLKKL